MHCEFCGQKLGALKRQGSKFCSAEHKRLHSARSSRLPQEKEDAFAYYERWCDDKPQKPKDKEANFRGVVAVGAVILVLGAATFLVAPSYSPRKNISLSPESAHSNSPRFLSSLVTRLLGGQERVYVRDNFEGNFHKMWTDLRPGSEWSYDSGRARPGRLRIWTPSAALTNYDFEFVGQIERKSMDYAFRASNGRNFYATKLTLAGTGSSAQSELIRYTVLDGKIQDRIQLPIPVSLTKNTDYWVHLRVRGMEFLTSIDGQVVSSWRDRRISRGGVGFFSEDGELASLKWASLSERDSLVGQILSHFSLFTLPTTIPDVELVQ